MDITTALLILGLLTAFVLGVSALVLLVQRFVDGGSNAYNIPYEQKSTEHA